MMMMMMMMMGMMTMMMMMNPKQTGFWVKLALYCTFKDYIDLAKARKLVRYDIVWAMSANIIQQASVIMKILMSREKNCKNCVLMKMIQKLW